MPTVTTAQFVVASNLGARPDAVRQVRSELITGVRRTEVLRHLQQELDDGGRVLVVCPAIGNKPEAKVTMPAALRVEPWLRKKLGASVPMDYWRHIGTKSADAKIALLQNLAWPAEFMRLRQLLCTRIPALKPEEVRSVEPLPGLEGLL